VVKTQGPQRIRRVRREGFFKIGLVTIIAENNSAKTLNFLASDPGLRPGLTDAAPSGLDVCLEMGVAPSCIRRNLFAEGNARGVQKFFVVGSL